MGAAIGPYKAIGPDLSPNRRSRSAFPLDSTLTITALERLSDGVETTDLSYRAIVGGNRSIALRR